MSKETRRIKQARRDATAAFERSYSRHATTDTLSFSEIEKLGNSVMHINRALEKSPQKVRAYTVTNEEKAQIEQLLLTDTLSNQDYFRVLAYGLAKDPLNPAVHLVLGRYFLDPSHKHPDDTYDMPAYHNIIALASFATASRLDPDLSEARDGMQQALSYIRSTKETARIANSSLTRLIKGEVAIKQGDMLTARYQLGSVKPGSAYKELANKRLDYVQQRELYPSFRFFSPQTVFSRA